MMRQILNDANDDGSCWAFCVDGVVGHPPASRFARRVPLALCEGGGQPRGLPLQGFAPPLSLRDISPASGGKRNPPHQHRNTKQPQPIIRIMVQNPPSAKRKGARFRLPHEARRGMRPALCSPIIKGEDHSPSNIYNVHKRPPSFASFKNHSHHGSNPRPSRWAFRPLKRPPRGMTMEAALGMT